MCAPFICWHVLYPFPLFPYYYFHHSLTHTLYSLHTLCYCSTTLSLSTLSLSYHSTNQINYTMSRRSLRSTASSRSAAAAAPVKWLPPFRTLLVFCAHFFVCVCALVFPCLGSKGLALFRKSRVPRALPRARRPSQLARTPRSRRTTSIST